MEDGVCICGAIEKTEFTAPKAEISVGPKEGGSAGAVLTGTDKKKEHQTGALLQVLLKDT